MRLVRSYCGDFSLTPFECCEGYMIVWVRGPAIVSFPSQALGPIGMACERTCVSLRPCLRITKPILGVQAWPGFARQRFRV